MIGRLARRIRGWTFLRLVLVCAGWFVLSTVIVIALALIGPAVTLFLRDALNANTGSGGIGAVSGSVEGLFFLAFIFVPIVFLMTAWLWQRFL